MKDLHKTELPRQLSSQEPSCIASAGDAGDSGSNPGSRRSPGEGNGSPFEGNANSSIAWKIPWTDEPCSLPSTNHKKLATAEQLSMHD